MTSVMRIFSSKPEEPDLRCKEIDEYKVEKFDVKFLLHLDSKIKIEDVKDLFVEDCYSGPYKYLAIYQYIIYSAIMNKEYSIGDDYSQDYISRRVAFPVLKEWSFNHLENIAAYNDKITVYDKNGEYTGIFRMKIKPARNHLAASLVSSKQDKLLQKVYGDKYKSIIRFLKKVQDL
ncbi:M protein [Almendravirus cootbay]|uniref:M protein n=1 Tax=Almendravirus cootbay TaxID=1972685 RepID=UPI001E281B3D|nr:M protein [Almendravirus cootbay]